MKKVILAMGTLLVASSSFATTVTCRAGDPKSAGVEKVITSEALKQSMQNGILLEKGSIKYLLTLSNIYDEKDYSKIIAADAMVLTTLVNGSSSQSMISDGNNMMYLDSANSVAVVCKRAN